MSSLTSALETGTFTSVDFVAKTDPAAVADEYGDLTGNLFGKLGAPHVSATKPTFTGNGADRAKSTLTWAWGLPGGKWTYQSEVELAKKGDTWEFVWEPTVVSPVLTEGRSLHVETVQQQRGEIMSTSGATLIADRPVVTVGIDKTLIDPVAAPAAARDIAKIVDINPKRYAKRVRAAGAKAFVEALSIRKPMMTKAKRDRIAKIKGAAMLNRTLPLGPTKQFASPVVGIVGEVTAEMMKKKPGTYLPGDHAGLSGLQARYDDRLSGKPGLQVTVVDDKGEVLKNLYNTDPVDGQSLTITLDEGLQKSAEKVLKRVKPESALVAIRPSDGAVLAAANGKDNKMNLATYGQAAPGSTFKAATTLALLRKGFNADSQVKCPAKTTVDGKTFTNDSWFPKSAIGEITLAHAVAESCNTAMVGAAEEISHAEIASAAASLGFGIDREAGFTSYFGQIPEPGSDTEHAADLIGQGKVLASPLVMASVIGSIQAGHTVVPNLVEGQVAKPSGVEPLAEDEAEQLRTIFRGVVTDGTGRGLLDVPGKPVIAKTGTAEFDRNGKRLTHTWMIAAQGDLAVAVYVDEGENGAATSGPLLEAFLRMANER
ncbi:cell division protein FtsI/penicillin-binding protein 2 [Nocardioides albertanoniae]|uniref:Cell division protein FtsI/penicillin-binding protein 2 n=1 Tax=Nocardioides albertanoniae TaxID=1175486 RepID=A0A543AE04_9ACTN|nr:penicillin-binding transpeptidase domain-containing protein [Nocardioides albertanoniae]TQL70814.1 cell division protein FtsI/penicillin-binding protein 2 [Nocardioides albertanoniae]